MIKINKENFRQYVLEGKKPALVEFSAPWCTYCRRIGPAMKKIAQEQEEVLLTGDINIDEEEELMKEYGVEVVPTLMIFKDGEKKGEIVAPDSKAKIENFIRECLG